MQMNRMHSVVKAASEVVGALMARGWAEIGLKDYRKVTALGRAWEAGGDGTSTP